MGYEYNPDAIPKIEAATEAIHEYCDSDVPKVLAITEELAAQSGSKKFIDNVNALRETTEAFKKTLLDFCGEAGDKMDAGTLEGYVTGAKKLAQVLGE